MLGKTCRIVNETKKTVLSEKAICCASLWRKASGLMFSPQKDLLFIEQQEKITPLHMFFVFYPIDVVYLDKSRKIVEIKEHFLPFTFYTPKKKAQYVLELHRGAIRASRTNVTDSLVFQ
ncbi:DUF192 domain-containing protein [Candidatus Woesearchaeota archaeon]|nr:DUF192 domain-containing protein [Candidatus Woesearchaeota archaeon]